MKKNWFFSLISFLVFLSFIGGTIFFFLPNIKNFLGLEDNVVVDEYLGKPFVFSTGESSVTIPDKFPEETVEALGGFIEKGGMPLRLEEKGNGLPFGIP